MELFIALIFGIIQGITEWLPISSEGITSLILISFFGKTLEEAVFFSIWLHSGTLLAAIVFFRRDLLNIIGNIVKSKDSKKFDSNLPYFLIISTFFTALIGTPLVLVGLNTMDIPGQIATVLIGVLLIFTGVFQIIAKKDRGSFRRLRISDGVAVGSIQGFSALPGVSRSGMTISALLLLGYRAKEALRLSYLMSIPVILGAEIGVGLLNKVVFDLNVLAAAGLSFVTGLLTVKLFFSVAERINFGYFCILIGVLSCLTLLLL